MGPPTCENSRRPRWKSSTCPPRRAASPTRLFTSLDGKTATLADFKGRVVVMNLWATWCAPCKAEMPTLAKLQAAYATQPVTVLPISVDRDGDLNLVNEEMTANPPLKTYRDPSYKCRSRWIPNRAASRPR
jgi:thiol-disulfide isomerase/thioredoxin